MNRWKTKASKETNEQRDLKTDFKSLSLARKQNIEFIHKFLPDDPDWNLPVCVTYRLLHSSNQRSKSQIHLATGGFGGRQHSRLFICFSLLAGSAASRPASSGPRAVGGGPPRRQLSNN